MRASKRRVSHQQAAAAMSVVHLQNVEILNPNAAFHDPYVFKVTFEAIAPLADDLEWSLIYVGSAQSKDYDQELDNCLVGPVPVGVNSFEFEAAAPDSAKIPPEDLLGVTVILLTGAYKDNEFIRVGYYVHNDYEDPELRENPPEQVDLSKVRREVLAEKPRVTRFNIKWYVSSLPPPSYAKFGVGRSSILSTAFLSCSVSGIPSLLLPSKKQRTMLLPRHSRLQPSQWETCMPRQASLRAHSHKNRSRPLLRQAHPPKKRQDLLRTSQ